ncbi:hypothetical protein GOD64_28245 [Sinorhizobium medicae]|nr:hypothetical protein [Sinorhizobium medicae]
MPSKQGLVIGAFAVLAIGGAIAIVRLVNQTAAIEAARVQLQSDVERVQGTNNDLSKQISDLKKANTAQVAELKASIAAISNPPSADELAAKLISQARDDLVSAIAARLAQDPESVSALRGRDADPDEVAGSLLQYPNGVMLANIVGGLIWASHREDLKADPELIATIASAVYDTYGKELAGATNVKEQAALIADELANEPAFAALVAAAQER